jgi:phosphatidylserine decarboxylase
MRKDDHTILDSVLGSIPPIHRDGFKFVALFALASLILFAISGFLGWIGVVATLWCAYFFRDPERVVPMQESLVVSAADGRVSAIDEVAAPKELGLGAEKMTRISVFLSVFDVHIQRSPVAGRILRSVYTPGLFLNAELDKASEDNERRSYLIETGTGRKIAVVQIAGLIARRIVAFAHEGQATGKGERIGLIRFGSRVDVYLPAGIAPRVCVGQTAIGGETVLADLNGAQHEADCRAV